MMKNRFVKKYLALLLSFAVFALMPAAFTQEASAASKKTYYVTTKVTTQTQSSEGTKVNTYKYSYFKNGLQKKIDYGTDGKVVHKRNSKGYISKSTYYTAAGAVQSIYTYKYKYNNKGLATSEKCYYQKTGGAKVLNYSTFMSYHSNGRVKRSITVYSDGTKSDLLYYSSGKYKKYVYTDENGRITTTKYDKYGSEKSYYGSGVSELHTTLKHDKKGNITKDVYTTTYDGYTTKTIAVTKYKYDKHKNIRKAVTTTTRTEPDGSVSTSVYTYTAKYKAVKVAKKYQHFFPKK